MTKINTSTTVLEKIKKKTKENVLTIEEHRKQFGIDFVALEDAISYVICIEDFKNKISVIVDGQMNVRTLNDDGTYFDISYRNAKEHFLPYHFSIYKNLKDRTEDKKTEIKYFDIWSKRPDIERFTKEVFLPFPHNSTPPQKNGEWNLWKGYVEPKPFDIDKYNEFIPLFAKYLNIFGDEDAQKYILNWLAWTIQNPDKAPGVALIFWGEQGCGKSFLAENILTSLLSHENVFLDSQGRIFKQFTKDFYIAKFVCIEEAKGSRLADLADVFKDLITKKRRETEGKFANTEWHNNVVAYMATSNHAWSIPVEVGDRRFSVFHVSNILKGHFDFWTEFAQWIEGEGKHYLIHMLLNRNLTGFDISEVYENEAKVDLMSRNLPPTERFIVESLKEGLLRVNFKGEDKELDWGDKEVKLPRDCLFNQKTFEASQMPNSILDTWAQIFHFPEGWKRNWKNLQGGYGTASYIKLPPAKEAMKLISEHLKLDQSMLFRGCDDTNVHYFKNEKLMEYKAETDTIEFENKAA